MKISNNNARFGWGFSLVFLFFCAAITYILIRDGSSHIAIDPPSNPNFYPPWFMPVVISVFWIVGLSLAHYMTNIPCTTVEVKQNEKVKIEKRYLFKKEIREISFHQIASIEDVKEIKDSEGDPYFIVQLMTDLGDVVDIAENNTKSKCDEIKINFNKLIKNKTY